MSRLAWGVWVEMSSIRNVSTVISSRLAWGVWVEILLPFILRVAIPSRLAWGSWNRVSDVLSLTRAESRLAWGVWVEMMKRGELSKEEYRHVSHEACELKCRDTKSEIPGKWSRLAWGVWVEIGGSYYISQRKWVTSRMRRVSWNSKEIANKISLLQSRLAWGVWVEMVLENFIHLVLDVTPRMRRVSWNSIVPVIFISSAVTPRMRRVSWNCLPVGADCGCRMSRLAWGVWVEIAVEPDSIQPCLVTPRIDGMFGNESNIPDEFKVKPNYKEICKKCKHHESTWGEPNND